jgi:hypothetical protein
LQPILSETVTSDHPKILPRKLWKSDFHRQAGLGLASWFRRLADASDK